MAEEHLDYLHIAGCGEYFAANVRRPLCDDPPLIPA
ncbi:Unknown protein sequence [Pseudomonas caricapapayae]|uniref:Uncharacterized protein n=1 Tax=Pseudomonas caricapapayae TaxID=46678 RepID=A0A0P9JYR8_9PSED|nr:Unknown protein sequence [Pseudomonas caricapapayae]RMM08409.1 hypothetical protein ALQ84_00846 [Pseudomonas caricapapayae]